MSWIMDAINDISKQFDKMPIVVKLILYNRYVLNYPLTWRKRKKRLNLYLKHIKQENKQK